MSMKKQRFLDAFAKGSVICCVFAYACACLCVLFLYFCTTCLCVLFLYFCTTCLCVSLYLCICVNINVCVSNVYSMHMHVCIIHTHTYIHAHSYIHSYIQYLTLLSLHTMMGAAHYRKVIINCTSQ